MTVRRQGFLDEVKKMICNLSRIFTLSTLLLLQSIEPVPALEPDSNDTYTRIVDGGSGLCTVTSIPGPHFLVYDAGHWWGSECIDAVREILGSNFIIDLMVISHTDADHLGQAADILAEYDVRRIIRVGQERTTNSWRRWNDAVAEETESGASVLNLQSAPLVPGTEILLGEATVTLVAGWPMWTEPGPNASEKLNAVSIVIRLEYAGGSILFTGDTIGKRKSDPNTACKDAEKAMVDNIVAAPLKSDVLLAPHHGGDNGSSACFIQEVDPNFVVFSAGHSHDHPTADAAGRYLAHGVLLSNMFRTDLGDDESANDTANTEREWDHGRIPGCSDRRGDEDVDIVLRASGAVEVAYRNAFGGC